MAALFVKTLCEVRGIPNANLAWVPVANFWVLGQALDNLNEDPICKQAPYSMILVGLCVGSLIPYVGTIVVWGFYAALLYSWYKVLYSWRYLACSYTFYGTLGR